MAYPPKKPVGILGSADPEAVKNQLQKDNDVTQFTKAAAKFLEETEKPTVLTLDEFRPFVPLFTVDEDRLEKDSTYRMGIMRLLSRYREITNAFQPTIVIQSRDNPIEVVVFPQTRTRIKSDFVVGDSKRASVPAALPKTAPITRDEMIIEASMRDIITANSSPEQQAEFARVRVESALIVKRFVQRNMSPEKRQAILGSAAPEAAGQPLTTRPSDDFDLEFDDD